MNIKEKNSLLKFFGVLFSVILVSITTMYDSKAESAIPDRIKELTKSWSEDKISNDSQDWDGIVEEHFRKRSDLLNPFRMFGNPLVILYRFYQVYSDTRSFLDYKTIEPYLVEEYHIKSLIPSSTRRGISRRKI